MRAKKREIFIFLVRRGENPILTDSPERGDFILGVWEVFLPDIFGPGEARIRQDGSPLVVFKNEESFWARACQVLAYCAREIVRFEMNPPSWKEVEVNEEEKGNYYPRILRVNYDP